jgi:uncharacterized membrane protein YkoI
LKDRAKGRFIPSMKLLSFFAFAAFLSLSSLQANPPNRERNAKITKNEAEHIALKHYPGERVQAAKLATVQGKLIWSLQLTKGKNKSAHEVAVDAMTGRIAQPAP